MVTGIAQKSYKGLFWLWPIKKNDIEVNETKNYAQDRLKAFETKKNWNYTNPGLHKF